MSESSPNSARSPWLSIYELIALFIIALATGIRISLVALGWPLLDSDEGTFGLMALHIAQRGEHPIFFYGQSYMGAFESYLGALMFRLFGVSAFSLRLGLILMFAVFLAGMYLLTRLLFTRKWALVTLVLLALGSNTVLTRELVVVGGALETLLCGVFLLLIAAWLALSSGPTQKPIVLRLIGYSLWGFVAGFGLWSHMLVLPFILISGLLLLCFCRRELFGWAMLCIVVFLLIGAMPLIWYNIHAPAGHDTLTATLQVNRQAGISQPPFWTIFPQQIKGALLVSLPAMTNAHPICPAADVHLLRLSSFHDIHCTLAHSGWTLGILILWMAALILTLRAIWRLWSQRADRASEERQALIQQCARLAVLATATLTLGLYALSPSAYLFPVASSRYLIGLLIATPVLLWPLWSGGETVKPLAMNVSRIMLSVKFPRAGLVLKRGILVLIGAVYLLGTISIFTGYPSSRIGDPRQNFYITQYADARLDLPQTQALNHQEAALIAGLLRMGTTHIYADYWTCDRIIFQSQERIICSALKDQLEPGHERYQPYHNIVAADPHAAYVFPLNTPQAAAMARRVVSDPRYRQYQRVPFDGYEVYILPR